MSNSLAQSIFHREQQGAGDLASAKTIVQDLCWNFFGCPEKLDDLHPAVDALQRQAYLLVERPPYLPRDWPERTAVEEDIQDLSQ